MPKRRRRIERIRRRREGSVCWVSAGVSPRRSERTLSEDLLAWASIAVPAWVRICERVNLTISEAMSVSRMRDSEAERFSTVTERLAMVCSKRFW